MGKYTIHARVNSNLIFNGISYDSGSVFKGEVSDRTLSSLKPFLDDIIVEQKNIIVEATLPPKKPTTARKRKVVGIEE